MGCGCTSNTPTPSGDGYLLIKSTGIGANQCESAAAEESDCSKQEPEFDSFLSGFLVPLGSDSITVQVCNAFAYTVGQWIESVTPYCIFQIVGVNAGSLILRASFEDGSEININPIAGTQIPVGTLFVTRGKPQNLTEDEILEVFNTQEQILVEALIETTETAEVRFVGVTVDDPGDTDWKKALRYIKGLFIKAGKLFMDAPTRVAPTLNHRPLYRNAVSGEIVEVPNASDGDDVEINKQYFNSITSNGEQLLEAYALLFIDEVTLASGSSSTTDPIDLDVTISDSSIIDIIKRLDHYYIDLDVFVNVFDTTRVRISVKINGVEQTFFYTDGSSDTGVRAIFPVKVPVDTNEFTLLVEKSDNTLPGVAKDYSLKVKKVYR